ncbi:hypothetical protein MYCTH_2299779 [Thermothelomyces thermophilus ATCC 42464]|uniref:Uncharacterized protein n=1 Tax=Thermothelomyces thermophilus (strain ATCC 42464 / BCRC 31852 / DSM 1799) TaxID=573729 RepID=G2PZK6_THET4|nr:uncharacterized protein MYCTH_2299779 [Thermothelomyces thermophilus ATCC 42464]AEO55692.1 hypothetical protein MYCTH_2299779 [Thermothelomyces thermophilus ATCC 42464]
MGHTSKFVFPLPGRRSKPAPPPMVSAPLTTKAQKILGAADLNLDVRAIPGWETQSNSGISIAVTESTAAAGEHGNGAVHKEGGGGPKASRDRRWEQESDIIPSALNSHQELLGSMVSDDATEASSLRRRQSSSTITSYYDKSKLPLSISQQTSNSAMAKGLPPKAMALLDMDGEFAEPKKARKKPSKLDLSALLQRSRSPRHLHPDGNTGLVLDADLLTKSPSAISASTAAPTPPLPVGQQADGVIRKRLTRESLRSNSAHQTSPYDSVSRPEQHTKASIELHNLYDHYEQRTFADAFDQNLDSCDYRIEPPPAGPSPAFTTSTTGQSGKAFLSPFPTTALRPAQTASKPSPVTAADLKLAGVGAPSSPVPADCASVSSRHTRTSKASKRTDRSLQEIDLLQNSVLALSSDSEDDYELSSKGSLTVPPLSDGQASPTSPRSSLSQVSAGAYDGSRGKAVKRTSFAPSPQFLPGGHGPTAAKGPEINPRTSSLNSRTSSSASSHGLVRETSRLSIGTTSTDRTLSNARNPPVESAAAAKKEPKKMRSESQFDFPAPPSNRGSRSASVSRISDLSYPASLSSDDFHLQSHRLPVATDNGSIRSGTSLGSTTNTGRRGSAASSIHDGNSGRFMAVTRQEEMLLAALRMKRARMREDIIAEFEGDMERDEHHELRREMTNDSIGTSGSMTRQSSRSTMRQEMGALSARPRRPSEAEPRREHLTSGDLLGVVIPQSPLDPTIRTPVLEIGEFIPSEESRSTQSSGALERKDSRASSVNSQRSGSSKRRSSLGSMTAPASRRSQRGDGSSSRQNSRQVSPNGHKDLPHRIPEDPAEDDDDDDDVGIPRPDSPISPSDFPVPVSIRNNQQVRLSAVGFYKPSSDSGW